MKPFANRALQRLYVLAIQPHSSELDSHRREFILNTLLSGLLFVAALAILVSLHTYFWGIAQAHHLSDLLLTVFFGVVTTLLLTMSRRRHSVPAAYLFAGFLLLSAVGYAVFWGFNLAQAELVFALTIVIAGVLFTAPLALITSVIVSLIVLIITYLQVNHLQSPQTYWRQQPPLIGDAVGYIAIFIVIGLVSWLSNREIDQSLQRARRSEAALQKERDNLEVKVIERTRQLEDLQLSRLLELQPFAEFGRIGASLVHEIANPLTAASMQLEVFSKEQHSDLVRQVQRNLSQLERYLTAARKQIKRESRLKTFAVGSELKQILNLLQNRAQKAEVQLVANSISGVKLYGDVVKFNQLVANLLANAIDATEHAAGQKQPVTLQVEAQNTGVTIIITDFGTGISPQAMSHLFEPFYSTKKTVRSGLGIGLALVKQYVEHDFGGSINVTSDPVVGTTFTVYLAGHHR